MTARSAAEIRADLADCDRDGLPWPSAARRLLADIEPLLARLEAVKAVCARLRDYRGGFDQIRQERKVIAEHLEEEMDAAVAALSVAPQPEPDGPWAVDLVCCGRDDGVQVCATWSEADAFRQSYIEPTDHGRSGILHRATPGTRLGYHGPAPSFPAGTQPEPPASDEPAASERYR